jgi:hypothetical protein
MHSATPPPPHTPANQTHQNLCLRPVAFAPNRAHQAAGAAYQLRAFLAPQIQLVSLPSALAPMWHTLISVLYDSAAAELLAPHAALVTQRHARTDRMHGEEKHMHTIQNVSVLIRNDLCHMLTSPLTAPAGSTKADPFPLMCRLFNPPSTST